MPTQMVKERKICWPKPDATCIEGGCLYCEDGPWKSENAVRRFCMRAEHHGKELMNRGNGKTTKAMAAYEYGISHGWGNAPTRTVEKEV